MLALEYIQIGRDREIVPASIESSYQFRFTSLYTAPDFRFLT